MVHDEGLAAEIHFRTGGFHGKRERCRLLLEMYPTLANLWIATTTSPGVHERGIEPKVGIAFELFQLTHGL